jgi:alpha-1,2-mannosyltransferase
MRGAAAHTPLSDSAGHIRSANRQLSFRWSTLVVLLSWTAVSAVLLVTTVPPHMPRIGLLAGGEDLDVYRDGARHVMADLPLYTEPFIHGLRYTYTPFSTLMFLPFGLLPGGSDHYIWMAANLVVLVAIIALSWQMLGYRITPYLACISALLAIVCMFLEPVRTTLFYGQINLVLMLLVLWDTSSGERSRLKGIGVGIAAGIKLTPAYFVLYYLVLRQWRAAAVAVTAITATVGVSWMVLPDDSRQYWAETFVNSTRIGDDWLPANQSLRGAIARLTGATAPTWVWLLAAISVVVASMWIAARLYRGGERLLAVTVTGLSAAVVSPFSWTHHWVWFVPLIVYLVHRAGTNSWWWLCSATLFVAIGSWAYRFPFDTEPRVGLYLFPPTWITWHALVNLYILVYAATMIGAAVIAIRTTRDRRRLPP